MNIATWLVLGGIFLIFLGFLIWIGLPLGNLPGDVHYQGEKTSIDIPIMTSIIISVIVTLALNAFFFLRK